MLLSTPCLISSRPWSRRDRVKVLRVVLASSRLTRSKLNNLLFSARFSRNRSATLSLVILTRNRRFKVWSNLL